MQYHNAQLGVHVHRDVTIVPIGPSELHRIERSALLEAREGDAGEGAGAGDVARVDQRRILEPDAMTTEE